MKYLVDNQLPPGLARFLAATGRDALHVRDLGWTEASDREIWDRACLDNRVVISMDEDFLHLALRNPSTQFLWVRTGNCRTPRLLELIQLMLEEVERCLVRGDIVVELR